MTLQRALSRLRFRLKLQKRAKSEHHAAQRALELARGKDLHPRQHLVNAVQEALTKLRLRNSQVDLQRKVVAKLRKAKGKAAAPKVEQTNLSPNRSNRNGVKPRIIVLHITVSHNRPGQGDVKAILDYFDQPSTKASSHVIVDAEGYDARCVPDGEKAWTQAAYNPQSLSIEQIEYADKSRARWMKENRTGLDKTAQWVAWWSYKYDIPLKFSTISGVCEHRHLGAAGGGHSDCGPGYPLDYVIRKAQEYAKAWA